MTKQIKAAIAALSPELKVKHDECVAQGYKDEHCPKCKVVFLAHHHFVRCENKPCAMSNGKSFMDMWMEAAESAEAKQNGA